MLAAEAENIKVVCRVRPSRNSSQTNYRRLANIQDTNTIVIASPLDPKIFTFDYVAPEDTSQEELFQTVGYSYAQSSIDGYNVTILCYGQTGSGKTYTLFGEKACTPSPYDTTPHSNGLVPRILEHIWEYLDSYKNTQLPNDNSALLPYSCTVTFFEIYQEKVYDLLDMGGGGGSGGGGGLRVRDDTEIGVYVENCTSKYINSAVEVQQYIDIGCANRHIGETKLNKRSSRSHAILQIQLEVDEEGSDGLHYLRKSKLTMVDLAGSESKRDSYSS
eukprot:gene13325-28232_t